MKIPNVFTCLFVLARYLTVVLRGRRRCHRFQWGQTSHHSAVDSSVSVCVCANLYMCVYLCGRVERDSHFVHVSTDGTRPPGTSTRVSHCSTKRPLDFAPWLPSAGG